MVASQLRRPKLEKVLVNGDERGRQRIGSTPLDGSDRAHNPKVCPSVPTFVLTR